MGCRQVNALAGVAGRVRVGQVVADRVQRVARGEQRAQTGLQGDIAHRLAPRIEKDRTAGLVFRRSEESSCDGRRLGCCCWTWAPWESALRLKWLPGGL